MEPTLRLEILANYLSECNLNIYLHSRTSDSRKNFMLHLVKVVSGIANFIKRTGFIEAKYEILFTQKNWKAEVLYLISISKLMNLNAYVEAKEHDVNACKDLCDELLGLYYDKPDDDFLTEVKNVLANAILNYTAVESNLGKTFIPLFVKHYYEKLKNLNVSEVNDIPFIHNAELQVSKTSFLFIKIVLYSFKEQGTTLLEALKSNTDFKPKNNKVLELLFSKIYTLSSLSIIMQSLRGFLLNCNLDSCVNWSNFALMILTIIKYNGYPEIKKVIVELIEIGLENKHSCNLYSALLLGRICSLKNGAISYLQWFTSTFSAESPRPLNTEIKARFFLNCLSDIVYFEEASYLKTHVNKVPYVPSSCQAELSEYLQIAKSCLHSMNESIELGFFENVEGIKTTDNDIRRLVDNYENTGRFPKTFLASLQFRRQYFEKQFLPKLLDDCPGPNSTQHRIIKDLNNLGRISSCTLTKHLKECIQSGNAFSMGEVAPQPHHLRGEEVHTRPLYRRGKKATAVKVFTISDESVHMLIFGVPSVNLTDEVKRIAEPFGDLKVEKVEGYPNLEPFTDLFHLTFNKVTIARAAKRRLDGLEFFGGILHVCYAPELETIDETRSKLNLRKRQISNASKNKKFRAENTPK